MVLGVLVAFPLLLLGQTPEVPPASLQRLLARLRDGDRFGPKLVDPRPEQIDLDDASDRDAPEASVAGRIVQELLAVRRADEDAPARAVDDGAAVLRDVAIELRRKERLDLLGILLCRDPIDLSELDDPAVSDLHVCLLRRDVEGSVGKPLHTHYVEERALAPALVAAEHQRDLDLATRVERAFDSSDERLGDHRGVELARRTKDLRRDTIESRDSIPYQGVQVVTDGVELALVADASEHAPDHVGAEIDPILPIDPLARFRRGDVGEGLVVEHHRLAHGVEPDAPEELRVVAEDVARVRVGLPDDAATVREKKRLPIVGRGRRRGGYAVAVAAIAVAATIPTSTATTTMIAAVSGASHAVSAVAGKRRGASGWDARQANHRAADVILVILVILAARIDLLLRCLAGGAPGSPANFCNLRPRLDALM